MHREDITEDLLTVASRWKEARLNEEAELRALEGDEMFDHQQRFLDATIATSTKRNLSSILFLATKA